MRKIVNLLPTTNRLKELIKTHGEQWILVEVRPVPVFKGEPGALIESLDHIHLRNVPLHSIEEQS